MAKDNKDSGKDIEILGMMAGILEETDGMQLPIRQLETLEYSAAVFSKGIHQVLEHSNSDISLSFNKRHLVKELS